MLAYPVLILSGTRSARLQVEVKIEATAVFSCSYLVSVCVLLGLFYFHKFMLFDIQANAAVWMSDCSFTQRLLNIHKSGHSAVWLLYGWCHMKLLPSQRKFCVHHSTMHQFIVSLYLKPQRMHVCLVLTRHQHLWQNDCNLLCAIAVTCGGGTDTEIRFSTKCWPWRRKFSCWDLNLRPFDHKSTALPLSHPHSPGIVNQPCLVSNQYPWLENTHIHS